MLFDETGAILLVRFVVPREDGEFVFWALPGGEIETGETEVEAAAAYFSALKPRKRIKVVESDMVPKSYIAGLVWAATENGEREPLGQRILEIPDDLIQFESRDPRST